jgi:predicted Fe-S protein YdhL (DUF1289 family)
MCEYFYEKQLGVNPEEFSWNSMKDDERQERWNEEKQRYGFDSRELASRLKNEPNVLVSLTYMER